jgi:hypothetical protein
MTQKSAQVEVAGLTWEVEYSLDEAGEPGTPGYYRDCEFLAVRYSGPLADLLEVLSEDCLEQLGEAIEDLEDNRLEPLTRRF